MDVSKVLNKIQFWRRPETPARSQYFLQSAGPVILQSAGPVITGPVLFSTPSISQFSAVKIGPEVFQTPPFTTGDDNAVVRVLFPSGLTLVVRYDETIEINSDQVIKIIDAPDPDPDPNQVLETVDAMWDILEMTEK